MKGEARALPEGMEPSRYAKYKTSTPEGLSAFRAYHACFEHLCQQLGVPGSPPDFESAVRWVSVRMTGRPDGALTVTCDGCAGAGWTYEGQTPGRQCPTCAGSGVLPATVPVPICSGCGGTLGSTSNDSARCAGCGAVTFSTANLPRAIAKLLSRPAKP